MNPKLQNTASIFVGWIALVTTFFLVSKIIYLFQSIDTNLSFKNTLVLLAIMPHIYSLAVVGFAALVCGYVTCWISYDTKLFQCLISAIFLCFLVSFIAAFYGSFKIADIIDRLIFIPTTLAGGIIRKIQENKKNV